MLMKIELTGQTLLNEFSLIHFLQPQLYVW